MCERERQTVYNISNQEYACSDMTAGNYDFLLSAHYS
jgi:hypothetical protein